MFSLFSIYINDISAATKGPESKKPNGSQIIRIGMGIYREIAVLASFNVLVSQVLRRRHEKTRLYYAARKKITKNFLHSTPIAPKVRLNMDRRFYFLPWKGQFSSKHGAMASRGREMSLKDLNFPLLRIRSSPRWAIDGVALGLVAMLHVLNPLDGERCFSRHFFVKWVKACPGYPCESGFVLVNFPPGHPCQGNFEWTA